MAAFPTCNVQIKEGDCNVAWESWDRNDFPVWQYFKENTSSECLNNWKGTGAIAIRFKSSTRVDVNKIWRDR